MQDIFKYMILESFILTTYRKALNSRFSKNVNFINIELIYHANFSVFVFSFLKVIIKTCNDT